MAARKGVIVSEVINSSDEWETFLSKPGLCAIDAHQSWCGPCKPVQVLFKRLKTEIGADKISFATADTDKIKELESYKGSCEPQFLFYGGGELNRVFRLIGNNDEKSPNRQLNTIFRLIGNYYRGFRLIAITSNSHNRRKFGLIAIILNLNSV